MPWYLLHPVAVHFPIAALTLGWGFAAAAEFRGDRSPWLADAARWLLWLGTLAAWAAMGLGLLAEETVPHVPPAWKDLHRHELLAYWTVGVFTGLSVLKWRLGPRWARWQLGAWLAGLGLLLTTGFYGGELVFGHGVGFLQE